jgi:hypothetical protein
VCQLMAALSRVQGLSLFWRNTQTLIARQAKWLVRLSVIVDAGGFSALEADLGGRVHARLNPQPAVNSYIRATYLYSCATLQA